MFKNYLKVSLRNIMRHKGYSLINVASLSIGLTCCILMLLWVQDEISYDRFHKNADHIYRVIRETQNGGKTDHYSAVPNPTAPLLKEQYPEVIDSVRFRGGYKDWLVQYGEKSFLNDRLGVAGPSFFRIFEFPFIKGDPNTALDHQQSVVLSESTAKKYFGQEEPMGKVMKINTRDFKVTGIMKDVPHNSHMQLDLVVPIINAQEWWGENLEDWNRDFELHTYILLDKNSSPGELNQKIAGLVKQHKPNTDTRLYLQPLKDIYLYSSDLKYDNFGLGNITYVYILSLIAFCILLIGCINFMNLSTARSGIRTKEIGLRKICGAHRTSIMKQFFAESVIFSFIALFFAVLLVYLLLPAFNNLSGKQLTLFGGTGNLIIILELAAITFLTGMIAGSYPSLFLSSFQPAHILKSVSRGGKPRGGYLRKLLVVLQFTFMVVLIFGLILIYNQLNFLKNKDLGFNKENILYFWGQGNFVYRINAIKNELLQNPDILAVSKSTPPIVELLTTTDVDWEGKKPGESVTMSPGLIDYDYLKVFNLEMAQGRFFSKEFPSDLANYVINEAAAKAMGIESPINLRLTFRSSIPRENYEGRIIGVIKDFHQHSLHKPITPIVFWIHRGEGIINIKFRPQNLQHTLEFLKNKWDKFVGGGHPFNYEFLDDTIDNFYKNERRIGSVVKYFTILAIFISCIGLLGLVSYTAQQRTKEIGIRKALGASESSVVLLFSKEFLNWVIAAIIIGSLAAWYIMHSWLQNFSYRISIEWWEFLLTGGIVLLIACVTVAYQFLKAAQANPVDSLRYE